MKKRRRMSLTTLVFLSGFVYGALAASAGWLLAYIWST
jgi:hypothetical protein